MTISMGKKYKTRDGRNVTILTTKCPGDLPVVGCLDDGCLFRWTMWGSFYKSGETCLYDLVEVNEWDDFKIDDPVMVRDSQCEGWVKAHFAGISRNLPCAFDCGSTSWSAVSKCTWRYCRRPTEDELRQSC